jgi:hypothetical protein
MSWPTCPKSKRIIRIVEECERTIFGEENQTWSPRTDLSHLILVKRINKILEEIGHKEIIDKKKIYEKTRIIAHNLGVSFWDESESDTDSEKEDDEHHEDENH